MKHWFTITITFFVALHVVRGATHSVGSADEIEAVIKSGKLAPGDTIVWTDGEYSDEELSVIGLHGTEDQPITLRAATPGKVILRGESRVSIGANWWVIEGFHFNGGDGKANSYNPIQFRGNNGVAAEHSKLRSCAITDLNADDESSKWVLVYGKNNTVEHCHFSGKKSKGALLTVELGYLKKKEIAGHRIASNYFADIPVQEGNDNEVIRIGFSGDQEKPATCVVERNLFVRCDGENEIISNKSSFNLYRSNTFRQCNGALVLRHGHHARVEGNYFFGEGAPNAGGIRIVDSHHVIVNNYLHGLNGTTWNAAISILGGKQKSGGKDNGYQAVDGITIAHNSIIDCKRSLFLNEAKGSRAPTGLFANNLVVGRSAPLVLDQLGAKTLTWQGNLFHGATTGLTEEVSAADPELKRLHGRLVPSGKGAVVDTAVEIEEDITHDISGQERPKTGRDIGADEVRGANGKGLLTPATPADVGVQFLRRSE